jgi:DNA adenine methylase
MMSKRKKLRPPFKIHGGKAYLCDWVIENFPSNYSKMHYIEPFGGAGSVLLNKNPSVHETYNDLHLPTANIFKNLVDRSKELVEKISAIEYSEKSFQGMKDIPQCFNDLNSAVSELILRRMSRGGMKKAFSWSERLRGGRPGDLNAWETFKTHLPLICERIKSVDVKNTNALTLISNSLQDENTLIYLDPPYLSETRTSKSVYDCEMTNEDHKLMADVLNGAKAKVIISGYDSGPYCEFFKDWRKAIKEMPNNSGQGKKKQRRIEVLWMNY